jgi:hypothetical protein
MKKLILVFAVLIIAWTFVPTKSPVSYSTGIPTMEIPVIYTVDSVRDSLGVWQPVQISESVAVFMSPGFDTATAIYNRGITVQRSYDATR